MIDQTAQSGEDFGHTLDFIENYETILVAGQEFGRIGEPGAVGGSLEIEVEGRLAGCNCLSQSGFADLAGASEGHCGLTGQRCRDGSLGATGNHACILSMTWINCNGDS